MHDLASRDKTDTFMNLSYDDILQKFMQNLNVQKLESTNKIPNTNYGIVCLVENMDDLNLANGR